MQGPDDRLGDLANVGNGHHFTGNPVKVHNVCIGLVEPRVPSRWNDGEVTLVGL